MLQLQEKWYKLDSVFLAMTCPTEIPLMLKKRIMKFMKSILQLESHNIRLNFILLDHLLKDQYHLCQIQKFTFKQTCTCIITR